MMRGAEMDLNGSPARASEVALTDFQRDCIEIFVRASQVLAVPRSIGEIYGLLFGTSEPLAMDDIVARLGISKGSASQGLRWLREVGALRVTYVPGDRRDHYAAETELRKLASGFLREQVNPHLESGKALLARLDESAEGEGKFAQERLRKLRRWHRFGGQLVPLLLRVAERF